MKKILARPIMQLSVHITSTGKPKKQQMPLTVSNRLKYLMMRLVSMIFSLLLTPPY
jgi:hypothetical protein